MADLARDYLERRRRQCLVRAESTADPAIAQIHRTFVAEYERKLAAVAQTEPQLSVSQ